MSGWHRQKFHQAVERNHVLYGELERERGLRVEAERERDDWRSKYEYANENFSASFQAERRRAEALAGLVTDLAIYRHATLGHKDYFHRGCTEKICMEARRVLAGEPERTPVE